MLLARPIPREESSGRLLQTCDVARVFGCSEAAVREMRKRGEFDRTKYHVTPSGIVVYEADYIAERARARELRPEFRARADAALGFGRAVEVREVQAELPLGREE